MKHAILPTIFLLFFANIVFGQAGTLDPTFGKNGISVTNLNSTSEWISDIAIQDDEKIICVGTSGEYGFIARYKVDGHLDSSFGNNGVLSLTISIPHQFVEAKSIKTQPDKKIVIAGRSDVDFVVWRYNSDGTPDINFGQGGVVITDINKGIDFIQSLVLQTDGKILIAGTSTKAFSSLVIVRYNNDGKLDETFADSGLLVTRARNFYNDYDYLSMGLNSENRIIIAGAGFSNLRVVLSAFNMDGTIDSSFGFNGSTVFSANSFGTSEYPESLVILPDDKILLCGSRTKSYSRTSWVVTRFNKDGTLDYSFGNNGGAIWKNDFIAQDITVQNDNKIIVCGFIFINGISRLAAIRFNSDGIADNSFGQNGLAIVTKNYSSSSASSVALQQDGKIVTGGSISSVGVSDLILARFNGDNNAAISAKHENNTTISKEFSVFPNPASNMLNITGLNSNTATNILITDNSGKILQKSVSVNKLSHTLSLNNLKPGIYFLQLTENGKTTVLKFLKQ